MTDQNPLVGTAACANPAPPQFAPDREVRFAVVMYGGVSLAIYINGVAQELLRMVRATAPEVATHRGPTKALLAAKGLEGSERVYRKLGQMIGTEDKALADIKDSDPIRRRFVVDILSGTSAGGINGIFLAKALANNQSLDQIKRMWIEQGELSLLINDKESRKGLKRFPQQGPPQSLLNSRRMYVELLKAFNGMKTSHAASPPVASPFVDELDLFVTTTDIYGLPLPLQLTDKVVYERRYRNVFHLLYSTKYACGGDRNDLGAENDPFLAYAARCTSSFPFAFDKRVNP
jgi:patatin-related protein